VISQQRPQSAGMSRGRASEWKDPIVNPKDNNLRSVTEGPVTEAQVLEWSGISSPAPTPAPYEEAFDFTAHLRAAAREDLFNKTQVARHLSLSQLSESDS
jgi:hypothetical protein